MRLGFGKKEERDPAIVEGMKILVRAALSLHELRRSVGLVFEEKFIDWSKPSRSERMFGSL